MSAEEYLKKTVPSNYEWQEHHENTLVLEAMEQYSQHKADEQAIEFAEWIDQGNAEHFDNLEQRTHNYSELLARFKQEKQ